MSEFSKGPWKLESGDGKTHIRSADGESLMCDEQYYPWVPSKDADWTLIAAAPELYEALGRCMVEMQCLCAGHSDAEIQIAKAVLAKAVGK